MFGFSVELNFNPCFVNVTKSYLSTDALGHVFSGLANEKAETIIKCLMVLLTSFDHYLIFHATFCPLLFGIKKIHNLCNGFHSSKDI